MKLKHKTAEDDFNLWLGKPAPRYTSFPPAPFFQERDASSEYLSILKALPNKSKASLYVHIPFCRSQCLYCGCNTCPTNRYERISQYLASLTQEISLISSCVRHISIARLHFGGGTPNIISNEDMLGLFETIRASFDLSGIEEVAMELDPREATEDQVRTLAKCGVNRVSLGLQDFTPSVQTAVNRLQSYEMIQNACIYLRQNGINRINFDLMYGLPLQTPQSMAKTAELASSLKPDRIALFSYAHVPQIKKHQTVLEQYGIPDPFACLELEAAARNVLLSKGYTAIGIDHFSKPADPLAVALKSGSLRRNFQGYTDDAPDALIGLGASSIGYIADSYFQNDADVTSYMAKICVSEPATKRTYATSPEDKLRKIIIERLMCFFECDIAAACRELQIKHECLQEDMKRLQPFLSEGLAAQEGTVIRLASKHKMAIRAICKCFDPYTSASTRTVSSRTA